jgi:hypothetical protein
MSVIDNIRLALAATNSGLKAANEQDLTDTLVSLGFTNSVLSNPAFLDVAQNFTAQQTFNNGVILPNIAIANNAVFDWYEEGAWTIELYDAVSGGNVSPTTATGNYTRFGDIVFVTMPFVALTNIDTTGMTGANAVYMTLPFTGADASVGTAVMDGVVYNAGRTQTAARVVGSGRVQILESGTGVADITTKVSQISGQDISQFTLVYKAG